MENMNNLFLQPSQNDDNEANETERWTSIIGGGALVLIGLQQRSLRGLLMALAGSGLVYQGVAKKSTLKQAQQTLGLEQTFKVEKTVTINKPAEKLYSFWRNFENLPTFMGHLKSIALYDEKRSHWVTQAPLGMTIEWDAEIIKDEPNQLIAWTSVDDSQIDHSGFVRFRPLIDDRGTEVKVVMEYNPPQGAIGQAIAELLGESPEQQISDELNRFKQLMEAGEIATI